jgi:protocatechuate 3,4-dioxygenase beta subunit
MTQHPSQPENTKMTSITSERSLRSDQKTLVSAYFILKRRLFPLDLLKKRTMGQHLTAILLLLLSSCANSQNQPAPKLVGGPCEGCEAIFEYGDRQLNAVDTLPDFNQPGTKIKITGTIYQNDGTTPAEDVILYVYHTNQEGIYPTRGNETGWAKRHGYIRGWVKTGQNGQYAFYTLQPGVYPSRSEPAHIHPTILEPNGKYYWLGSYHFEGDTLLTEEEMNPKSPRGGSSGLIRLRKEGDLMVGTRDFILGRNIPNYE